MPILPAMGVDRVPYVVLGAGVSGLAAGWVLGSRAIVLERERRPGGLVRTERRGDFWFDRTLHLLHFPDQPTEAKVRRLFGDELAPCTPEAWVETRSGVTRFPLQMHLGFYPRPPRTAPVRGMELLSQRLAAKVADLRLEHTVVAIDLEARTVTVDTDGGPRRIAYERGIVATLPLPRMIELCEQAPEALRARCRALLSNRVTTVALAIVGPRPTGRGHWRYFVDDSVCFTRLVYLHELDPDSAPLRGFGVLVDLTERAEIPREPDEALIKRVINDVLRANAIPRGCEVIDAAVMVADPEYVVFDRASHAVVTEARAFLAAHGVHALGRYGPWESSSMAQMIREGFALGAKLRTA